MSTKDLHIKNARFDTRLSQEQKDFFEKAALIGGFRNLTDFVVNTLQEKAKEIIAENDRLLASQRDREIFFDAIFNPSPPNAALKNAAEAYKRQLNS